MMIRMFFKRAIFLFSQYMSIHLRIENDMKHVEIFIFSKLKCFVLTCPISPTDLHTKLDIGEGTSKNALTQNF